MIFHGESNASYEDLKNRANPQKKRNIQLIATSSSCIKKGQEQSGKDFIIKNTQIGNKRRLDFNHKLGFLHTIDGMIWKRRGTENTMVIANQKWLGNCQLPIRIPKISRVSKTIALENLEKETCGKRFGTFLGKEGSVFVFRWVNSNSSSISGIA